MIERFIDTCLEEWKAVLAISVVLLAGGIWALGFLNIEAYPDPAPPLIEVITQNSGWSAEEMEKQITVPLETGLNGMPGLEHLRSSSLLGLSDVRCYFSYGTDYNAARQEVLNRLQMVDLPPGTHPTISPQSTIGEIFRYQLVGKGFDLRDLRETQDWVIERRLKQVSGVVDVVSFGGPVKEYHIDLDPHKLVQYGISVQQVVAAVQNANANTGASYLDVGAQGVNVRGIGLFRDVADIENVSVTSTGGIPVYIRQVGTVSIGRKQPLGRVGRDGQEDIVQGVVLMRVGGQSIPTLRRLKMAIEALNRDVLPKGMQIVPYSDRSDLVAITTHTVEHTMISGMILVAVIILAFLGDLRASLIVACTIPLSLCLVCIIMVLHGDSANLISMGAIDFGIIVDASVVMIENIHRHLSHEKKGMRLLTSEAAREVVSPIFFSTLIIFVSFLPVFTMRGVEGKIFGPMALTYAMALGGALLLALTFCPVMAFLFLKKGEHEDTALGRLVRKPYARLIVRAVARPWIPVTIAGAVLLATLIAIPHMGGEFMPKLEEGNLYVRATMPMSIAYGEASSFTNKVRAVFQTCPQVTTVVSQLGRPEDGTDPTSYFNCEFWVGLQPRDTWPGGVTKAKIVSELEERLQRLFPGVDFSFSQAIEDNVAEAMSGVKGENSVKLFGSDLETLEKLAAEISDVMRDVPGVKDLGVLHELGQPNLVVETDRSAAARYGVAVGDVNTLVNAAVGGTPATQKLEGDRRFDVVVRLQRPFRETPEAIGRIPVATSNATSVPLAQVAKIDFKSGAGFIFHEDNQRFIPIKFSVRGRDLQSTIDEARARIAQRVKLPTGYWMDWSGEFEQMQQALKRLAIVVPVSLLLVLFLLAKSFGRTSDALLIISMVPLAAVGGVTALMVRGITFSVSAAVGFISLLGVCVLQGVLVLSRIKQLHVGGLSLHRAIVRGSELQLRPVLMVAASAAIGLLPAALATGIGSETQRPLATVVVGGMITSTLVILLVLPAVYRLMHRKEQA